MGPAAAAVHGDPSSHIPVVGVTGTNGKTTTVRLIGDLLEQLGAPQPRSARSPVCEPPRRPELQRVLAEAHRQGHAAVAMEVSSHALDLHRVDGTRFAVGVFTNLGVDHLDFHGDLQATRQRRRVSSRRNSPISASSRPTRRRVSGSQKPPESRSSPSTRPLARPPPMARAAAVSGGEATRCHSRWPALQRHQCRWLPKPSLPSGTTTAMSPPPSDEYGASPAVSRPCTPAKRSPSWSTTPTPRTGWRPCSPQPGRSPNGRSSFVFGAGGDRDQGSGPRWARSPADSPTGSSSQRQPSR